MKARSVSGVTGRDGAVQARRTHAVHAAVWLAMLLAGCSGKVADGPVQWWHALEGGRIAQDRPPPPNADAPYANLSTVPARPTATPSDVRGKIAEGLVADRANVAYGTSLAPLSPPSGAIVQHPPQASDASSATMAAATPPRAAPRGAVTASALPPPPTLESPAIPAAPPPPPVLPGVAQSTLGVAPPVAPPTPPDVPVEPPAGAPVAVTFAAGSAVLTPDDTKPLQKLATSRGNRSIEVVGFGDAAGVDAAAQQAALVLALARARAIARALGQDGVPEIAVQLRAEAIGTGGVARIVE